MIFLRALRKHEPGPDRFPFSLPVIRNLEKLDFDRPVTFFVGENGSGKSTLLEAIAAGIGSITVGGHDIETDPTLRHARELGQCISYEWNRKTRRGFFLRAEDFFNFANRIVQLQNSFIFVVGLENGICPDCLFGIVH